VRFDAFGLWLAIRSKCTVTNVRVLICDDEPFDPGAVSLRLRTGGCRGGRGGRRRRVHRDRSPRLPRRDRARSVHARARRSVGPPRAAPVVPRCTGADGERHAGVEVFERARSLGATACFEKAGSLRRIPQLVARWGHPTPGDGLFYRPLRDTAFGLTGVPLTRTSKWRCGRWTCRWSRRCRSPGPW